LQPCREVQRLADNTALLRVSRSDQIANDNQPGCDANTGLQRRALVQCGHRHNQFKSRSNCALRVVLVRVGIAKINNGSVAVRMGYKTLVPPGRLNETSVVTLDNLA
jgi:hypothetical protein